MEYRLIPQRRSRPASRGRSAVTVLAVAATCVAIAACNMDTEPPTRTEETLSPSVEMGTPLDVDLSSYFEGSRLTYTASSADTDIVTVAVSGKTLTLTPVSVGSTKVTATAKNANGTESYEFTARVKRAPAEGDCAVGDVLSPGEQCEVPSVGTFSVETDGKGKLVTEGNVTFSAGEKISYNGFVAEKKSGTNTWEIKELP